MNKSKEYKTASICLNGHIISSHSEQVGSYCPFCGEKVTESCSHCGATLHGYEMNSGYTIVNRNNQKEYYCYNYGKPYPWTERIIQSAIELLSMDEELPTEVKELIKSSIPDLIVDTPKSPVAVTYYNKWIPKANKMIRDALYQLLVDVVSETVKLSLFPHLVQ